ncbi:MAG: HAMP domain-containing histidine kinase, partial [Bifidobacteriaceae bacterium]|nr:HAMP domain-containing histidine kinase [Bifidobacteriaceae bacterium]
QRSASSAQDNFDASAVGSPLTAETVARDTVRSVVKSGSAARAVSLVPPDQPLPGTISAIFTERQLWNVASADLRQAALDNPGQQFWQSVELPETTAGEGASPGIAVAQSVRLMNINYVLVLVYDLSTEQSTMNLIARVVSGAGLAMLVIVVLVAWLVTHQVARPVRQAAAAAAKLAGGDLDERLTVKGRDEVATLAWSFNGMAAALQSHIDELEDLSTLQRRFVSDVSHELRTPLATIRMASDMIYTAREAYPPAQARSAELLAAQVDRFDALLADLLEISRFDAGAAQLEVEPTELKDLVTSELEGFEALAAEKSVELRPHLADQPCLAELDRRRVSRIVRNLLVNAIEHAEGGPVDVYVSANFGAVAVVVRDHGVGLSDEQMERVFDRFWRADPARARTTGGTGLGLAIAVEDANLHGGRLDVWGRPGEGASFRLVLPRTAGVKDLAPPLELVPEDGSESAGLALGTDVMPDGVRRGTGGTGGPPGASPADLPALPVEVEA